MSEYVAGFNLDEVFRDEMKRLEELEQDKNNAAQKEAIRKLLEEKRKRIEDKKKKSESEKIPDNTNPDPNPQQITLDKSNCIFLEAKEHLSKDNKTKYSYPDTIITQDTMCPKLNWTDTHKVLQPTDLYMPTIRQNIDKMILIRDGIGGKVTVYDGTKNKITEQRLQEIWNKYFTKQQSSWIAQHLDADFKVDPNSGLLVMNYEHRLKNGILVPQRSETLEDYVDENTWVDLLGSANYQGLPTRKTTTQEFYLIQPLSNNNSVAWFDAYADGARLSWGGGPAGAYAALAVSPTQKI